MKTVGRTKKRQGFKWTGEPCLLVVLDGFGIGAEKGKGSAWNALFKAKMPYYRTLLEKVPHSQLLTHGNAVGLPHGVMGNSEVGHMTMGSGRVIYQDLTRISKTIETKEFFSLSRLTRFYNSSQRLHFMGLLSDGGVHSHIEHLEALLDLGLQKGVRQMFVHAFLDGRDTPPDSSPQYLQRLFSHKAFQKGVAKLSTLCGRYYAMDRDQRWERVEKAYRVLTGQDAPVSHSPGKEREVALEIIERSYSEKISDEFLAPILLCQEGAISDHDSVLFFNFRSDRAREITRAFTEKSFSGFSRKQLSLSDFLGMTQYDSQFVIDSLFAPQKQEHLFGQWLEQHGLAQFRIAETEKYAHVTFFFNGGREAPFRGEDRLLIPSPKEVATYDLKPEMSAYTVASESALRLSTRKYPFMLINFANADMVGHTGNLSAAIRAAEALDACIAQVLSVAEKQGYHTLLTADHGNAEQMCDHDGKPHTQHTLNPVPLVWLPPQGNQNSRTQLQSGTLADLMPTICDLMKLKVPEEVEGKSLLQTRSRLRSSKFSVGQKKVPLKNRKTK